MSDLQKTVYQKITGKEVKQTKVRDYVNENISNNFFIGTRMISNIVYPNEKVGLKGYNSLTDEDLTIAKIREYSPKFLKILRKIKRCNGTVFVLSLIHISEPTRPY